MDTDEMIVQDARMSIADIFDEENEVGFRVREGLMIASTLRLTNCVVALGGGAVKVPKNLESILKAGTLVYLKASSATIARRVFGDASRPMLAGSETVEELERVLERLLRSRRDLYERAQLHYDIDPAFAARDNAARLREQLVSAGLV
jgi:shikimate kinase